jgi:hypothetical protein
MSSITYLRWPFHKKNRRLSEDQDIDDTRSVFRWLPPIRVQKNAKTPSSLIRRV